MESFSTLLIIASVTLLLKSFVQPLCALKVDEGVSLPEGEALLEWIRSFDNGFVDDRVVILSLPLDENASHRSIHNSSTKFYRGVFTTAEISRGEKLCYIPWNTIIGAASFDQQHQSEYDGRMEDTVFHLLHEMRQGQSTYAPYLNLLGLQQHHNQFDVSVPSSWSLAGRAYLQRMLGDFLPPRHLERNAEWFVQHYGMGAHQLHAYFVVSTRAIQADRGTQWLLVPLVDLQNHQSDPQKINTARYASHGKGFEIVATQDIPAGSELYTKYWGDYTNYFFEEFGFVEDFPQRWQFDLRHGGGSLLDVQLMPRINTEPTNNETGCSRPLDDNGFDLTWFSDVPSNGYTIDILTKEWVRLKAMEDFYSQHGNHAGIPQLEKDLIWDYHRAISSVIRQILLVSSERC